MALLVATLLLGLACDDGVTDPDDAPPVELSDREVLELLYASTSGPDWTDNEHWLSDRPLADWYGVSVDESGSVVEIDLHSNDLSGRIPPAVGQLANLRVLILRTNELTGAMPPALGELSSLRVLDLRSNELTGAIPIALSQLPNLNTLYLRSNQLTGEIPRELGQLVDLRRLYLSNNQLTGEVPSKLSNLRALQELSVSHNPGLTGTLSRDLVNLIQLEKFGTTGTDLCAPSDPVFTTWLNGLRNPRLLTCDHTSATAYLMQAAQSRDFPVPLVAGEPV